MQQAQGELGRLKDKLNQLGNGESGSSDMVMPENFKPDNQKTRPFWKRMEYSLNFQTKKANNYLPQTTDIALGIGYKLNDKATVGIALAGSVGWGQDWKHIKITGQGTGIRSFIDLKAPDLFKTGSRFMGSLWFTAGAELHYNKTVESLAVLKHYTNWDKSAMAGLTKKFSMSSPLKNGRRVQGNIQLLYDFLYNTHTPPTPAFVWRVGYGL
jgi:hypothetical protein